MLRFIDGGGDHYSTAEVNAKWTNSSGVVVSSGTGRFGGNSLRLSDYASGSFLQKSLDAQATWAVGVGLLAVTLPGVAPAEDKSDEGFVALFNGKDFSGFKFFLDPKAKDADPARTWSVVDGTIHCTGKPNGSRGTIAGAVRMLSAVNAAPWSATSVAISAPLFPAPTTSTRLPA